MVVDIEVGVLKSVVAKLDTSLEKIAEVSNSISRLLAVHDERINNIEKNADNRDLEIKDLQTRITTQTKEIFDKLDHMETRMEDQIKALEKSIKDEQSKIDTRVLVLEKWRWYLLGAAAIIGYLVSYMDLKTLLK
jgi:peptidoglycan hydrolase CwlO-like protein